MTGYEHKLLELLQTTDPVRRNALAIELSSTRDKKVFDILIELVQRPELVNNRGTLVHSLKEFDCSDILDQVAVLVAEGNWEVAHEAFQIINSIEKASGDSVLAAYEILKSRAIDIGIEPWRQELLAELLALFD